MDVDRGERQMVERQTGARRIALQLTSFALLLVLGLGVNTPVKAATTDLGLGLHLPSGIPLNGQVLFGSCSGNASQDPRPRRRCSADGWGFIAPTGPGASSPRQ